MYIMTSRPWARVFVQAPFGGVTDRYPEPRKLELKLGSFRALRVEIELGSCYGSSGPGCTGGGAAVVASPARVLKLDTHSSSEADLSESSLPPISVAPMVSPFLCSDDSNLDTEIPERHVSPTTYIPEIPTAPILPAPSAIIIPSSEFPLAPIVAPLEICRQQAILIRPGEDIPIGRLYLTHPGRPCRALTMRKSVRPLPSHCLALRYTSHHLDHFTSRSSSSHSSLDHSSRHSISGHSLPGHTPPDTTYANLSTPPKFVHSLLVRTLRCSEAYLR
ncbi:hypothetical protein Tco_0110517 [Tanacetum coccineum]